MIPAALDQSRVALLRTNARLPVAKLAASLGVTRATVRARLDRLTKEGMILGFTVVLGTETEVGGICAVTIIEVDGRHSKA